MYCLSVYLQRGSAGEGWAVNVYDYGNYHGHFARETLSAQWQRVVVPIRWEAGEAGNKLINLRLHGRNRRLTR
ncbi:MAG: hypothetical protein WDN69_16020 [Aliidongia sp.]